MKHFIEPHGQKTYEDVVYLEDNDVEINMDLMPVNNNLNLCDENTEQYYDSMDFYYVNEVRYL